MHAKSVQSINNVEFSKFASEVFRQNVQRSITDDLS